MQTVVERHAREGPPESTRADRDCLSSSSAPPAPVGADSASDSTHLANVAGAAMLLDVAEPALQTAPPGIDEGALQERMSEDACQGSADDPRSHSVEPPTHAANTTDPVQHAIAISIASDTIQAAAPAVNKASILQEIALEDASTSAANGMLHSHSEGSPERAATSPADPLAERRARMLLWMLKWKQKTLPTGDAVIVEDASGSPGKFTPEENPKLGHNPMDDAELNGRIVSLGAEGEVLDSLLAKLSHGHAGTKRRRRQELADEEDTYEQTVYIDLVEELVNEGRPVRPIVSAQAAVRGSLTKPR